jgi:hypothetical protein
MGIKFDAYVTSRDAMNFVFECKTNPLMKGTMSRVCDKIMAQAWRKMKDSGEEFDFANLSEKPLDKMTDAENHWFVEKIDKANERLKRSLNARPRYNKYMHASNKHNP